VQTNARITRFCPNAGAELIGIFERSDPKAISGQWPLFPLWVGCTVPWPFRDRRSGVIRVRQHQRPRRQPPRRRYEPLSLAARSSRHRHPDGFEPRMGAAGTRVQAIKIRAHVDAGHVQHLAPKPLHALHPITRCVMTQRDRRISRAGNRAHLARSVQPRPGARHSVHRTTEAADAEQCPGAARLSPCRRIISWRP
jgi:hypothetical protein